MIGKDINYAQKCLKKGQLVAIPTETVYGLAANIYLPEAIASVFEVKKRPSFDPLIVHSDSLEKIKDLTSNMPDRAIALAEAFWPGPLTLVLPKSEQIHPLISAGMQTVALRVPNHPLTLSLLSTLSFPVAAPSANPFGYISPTAANHVAESLGDEVAYILDGGNCELGIESTVVFFGDKQTTILRKGALKITSIEKIIGRVAVSKSSCSQPKAPGMLAKHYAPSKKIILGNIAKLIAKHTEKKIGILSFSTTFQGIPPAHQFVLSPNRSYKKAAKNLFAYLHTLDKLPIDIILAELLPEQDLGIAINDRLRRAASDNEALSSNK